MSRANGGGRLLGLLAVGVFAACSNPDVCTRGVNTIHKIENEAIACDPDAGFPADTEATSEIATCEQDIAKCTPDEQKTIENSVTCGENLPQINCVWFTPSGAAAGFLFGLQAVACFPKGLSPACRFPTLPLDAGFDF